MGLELARDLEDLVAHPDGRGLVGPGYLYWNAGPALVGISLWGRPGVQDLAELGAVFFRAGAGLPRSTLFDTTLVEGIEPATFERVAGFVAHHRARLGHELVKVALVRTSGFVGAITAGFLEVTQPRIPIASFAQLAPAVEWLGGDPQLAQEVEARRDEHARATPLLAQLRQVFRRLGARAASGEVAKSLALSKRTLVRRLAEQGTTFHDQLRQFRIATAQNLMRDTRASLSAIASDAGFGSVQRFCTAFREATGETPATWRQHHVSEAVESTALARTGTRLAQRGNS